MKTNPYEAAVITLVNDLRRAFPGVDIKLQYDHPEVDLNIDILREENRPFDINLNLQGDELHLTAAGFWFSQFPCDRPDVLDLFRTTTAGLLSGSHRIVNHYRGRRVAYGEIQRYDAGSWQSVGYGYRILWFGRKRTEILCATRPATLS